MYRLITRDGDVWYFEDLEEARKNQYIFGGIIELIEDKYNRKNGDDYRDK